MELSLGGCSAADEGLRAVAATCTQLTELNLRSCPAVSKEMKVELRAKGVNIQGATRQNFL